MAAFAAGIFSHAMTAADTLTNPNLTSASKPQAGGSDGASSTSTTSATISANDFLTLLVTEMKNQDPTANNDPNQYINQLVNVNSLEQLIEINQNLSKALGDPSSQTGSIATDQIPATSNAQSAPSGKADSSNLTALTAAVKRAPGNLTVPDPAPAAATLAHALDGRPHPRPEVVGLR